MIYPCGEAVDVKHHHHLKHGGHNVSPLSSTCHNSSKSRNHRRGNNILSNVEALNCAGAVLEADKENMDRVEDKVGGSKLNSAEADTLLRTLAGLSTQLRRTGHRGSASGGGGYTNCIIISEMCKSPAAGLDAR